MSQYRATALQPGQEQDCLKNKKKKKKKQQTNKLKGQDQDIIFTSACEKSKYGNITEKCPSDTQQHLSKV